MASSRRSPPADGHPRAGGDPRHPRAGGDPRHPRASGDPVAAAVDAALARHLQPGARLLVALSGGRDSIVLADALLRTAPARGIALAAMHVHHGLSPNADRWAAFCTAWCRDRALPLDVARVDASPARARSSSPEAAAREARYRALAAQAGATGARAVALAHHADDQAETLLLQLARGAGPRGLASMAEWREDAQAAGRPPADEGVVPLAWFRPLLGLPRPAIEAAVAARALTFVDDESNQADRHRRNALRRHVVPALRELAPGYPLTLARAAALAAEAADLADDLAAIDAEGALEGGTLAAARLAALPPPRARNLLRWFLRTKGLATPSAARLAAMLDQLAHAARDARVSLPHDGRVIARHGGRVHVHVPLPPPYALDWQGERLLALPHGRLGFEPAPAGEGPRLVLPAQDGMRWTVRSRRGGERFRPHPGGAERRLKSLLQQSGMPAWQRDALPLLFHGERLAAVPGIGVDAGLRAAPDAPGLALVWQPA